MTLVPTFAATLDSLESIRDYVGEAALRAGLDSGASYGLRLAVDEIATNVVMHGRHDTDHPTIDLEAAVEDGTFVVRMYDSSAQYEPDEHQVPPDELAAPLEERDPGGLGLFLARLNVDELRYARVGARNLHDFRVRLP